MTPELADPAPAPAPDPVTDDDAFQALQSQAWALDSQVRQVRREREVLRQEQIREMVKRINERQAAELAVRYPNPVPDQVFAIAHAAAYDADDMSAEEKDFEEVDLRYRELVDLINAASAEYRTGLRNILNLHGGSIDPTECMECDMKADAHQLAPKNYPCRTLAEAHRVLG